MTVSPATVQRIEREQGKAAGGNGIGDLLAAIGNNVEGAIAEKRAERDGLVHRVLELNQTIAQLETHRQVSGEVSP